jgi:hypothetical protein
MKALSKQADPVMEAGEDTLLQCEFAGRHTIWARTVLYEAEWRINFTSDDAAAAFAVTRLQEALRLEDPPGSRVQGRDGSFAPSTELFFLKLDRSTDQLLARECPWRLPAHLSRNHRRPGPANLRLIGSATLSYLNPKCSFGAMRLRAWRKQCPLPASVRKTYTQSEVFHA